MKELETRWWYTMYVWRRTIDPDKQLNWKTLKYGWALGKGLTINQAISFSEQGYNTNE